MSTNLDRSNPSRHVTFNIITDKTTRFVSVTATHRQPSPGESERADWRATLTRNGITIHVVGRGDELTRETLQGLARTYVDGGSAMWVRVDLGALTDGGQVITALKPDEKPADWMETDPVWQSIKRINEATR